MDAQQLQNTLAKSLTEYLAEIKTLAAENETLRIQLKKEMNAHGVTKEKLRRSEEYAAILAARADFVSEEL